LFSALVGEAMVVVVTVGAMVGTALAVGLKFCKALLYVGVDQHV